MLLAEQFLCSLWWTFCDGWFIYSYLC